MAINVKLPQWLDTIIYDKYEAIFEPCPLDVVYNPDQEFEFVKVYLGTYFPRSFAEAVAITCKLVQNSNTGEKSGQLHRNDNLYAQAGWSLLRHDKLGSVL